jgi:hypothetical protein
MIPDPRCLVCTSPATRIAVEELRSKGASIRDIESRVRRSRSSIARHLKHAENPPLALRQRHRRQLAQPRRWKADGRCPTCGVLPDDPDPKALIRRAERALNYAETIVMKAVEDKDDRLALQALDRARASLEQLMKVHGMLHPGGVQDNRRVTNIFEGVPTDMLRAFLAALPPTDEGGATAGSTASSSRAALPAIKS